MTSCPCTPPRRPENAETANHRRERLARLSAYARAEDERYRAWHGDGCRRMELERDLEYLRRIKRAMAF